MRYIKVFLVLTSFAVARDIPQDLTLAGKWQVTEFEEEAVTQRFEKTIWIFRENKTFTMMTPDGDCDGRYEEVSGGTTRKLLLYINGERHPSPALYKIEGGTLYLKHADSREVKTYPEDFKKAPGYDTYKFSWVEKAP